MTVDKEHKKKRLDKQSLGFAHGEMSLEIPGDQIHMTNIEILKYLSLELWYRLDSKEKRSNQYSN